VTPKAPQPVATGVQASPSGIEAPASSLQVLEERFAPIVAAVARVAHGGDAPAVRLEGAMEIIFGAYGQSDPDFSEMLLTGWMRARHDKHHRLALAWQREQLRLSLEEILQVGGGGRVQEELGPVPSPP
jgi:hypothetical protein